MPAAATTSATVTEAHQRAAFAAFAWTGWTFEQAMADEVRSRLVRLRARQLCSQQARTTRRVVVPAAGAQRWLASFDCKRAAAGDRDDD